MFFCMWFLLLRIGTVGQVVNAPHIHAFKPSTNCSVFSMRNCVWCVCVCGREGGCYRFEIYIQNDSNIENKEFCLTHAIWTGFLVPRPPQNARKFSSHSACAFRLCRRAFLKRSDGWFRPSLLLNKECTDLAMSAITVGSARTLFRGKNSCKRNFRSIL